MSHLNLVSFTTQALRHAASGNFVALSKAESHYADLIGNGAISKVNGMLLGLIPVSVVVAHEFNAKASVEIEQEILATGRRHADKKNVSVKDVNDDIDSAIRSIAKEVFKLNATGDSYSDMLGTLLVASQLLYDAKPKVVGLDVIRQLTTVKGQCVLDFTWSPASMDMGKLAEKVTACESELEKAEKAQKASLAKMQKEPTEVHAVAYADSVASVKACRLNLDHAKSELEARGKMTGFAWFKYHGIVTTFAQIADNRRIVA